MKNPEDEKNKKSADKAHYLLPISSLYFVIAIIVELLPPGKIHWSQLIFTVIYAVYAAISDYKKDEEYTITSTLCIIADVICFAILIYLDWSIK